MPQDALEKIILVGPIHIIHFEPVYYNKNGCKIYMLHKVWLLYVCL